MTELALQLDLPLDAAPEASLPGRLYNLGLPRGTPIILTRNRSILLSQRPGSGVRLHAGYAWAPDEVLTAIVTFLRPGVTRAARLQARRIFLAFPVEVRQAPPRSQRRRLVDPADQSAIEHLMRLHQIFNLRYFAGELSTIPILLSNRMKSRLGEFHADQLQRPVEITISRRHLYRDGWKVVDQTLLHEMVHQWQCEKGYRVDHGPVFRNKAREVGIVDRATVSYELIRQLRRRP